MATAAGEWIAIKEAPLIRMKRRELMERSGVGVQWRLECRIEGWGKMEGSGNGRQPSWHCSDENRGGGVQWGTELTWALLVSDQRRGDA
jgi:hypothetical protein